MFHTSRLTARSASVYTVHGGRGRQCCIQVHHRQVSASYECRHSHGQQHADSPLCCITSSTGCTFLSGWRTSCVQPFTDVCSTRHHGHRPLDKHCATVHDRLLHPHLRHCSSSAVCTATSTFDVQSLGPFCSWPSGLKLVTRPRSDKFFLHFSLGSENFPFVVFLALEWSIRGFTIMCYINLLLTLTLK